MNSVHPSSFRLHPSPLPGLFLLHTGGVAMNDQLDVEDNATLLVPRPWLEPAVEEVRERGPLTIWSFAGRTYVKGLLGNKPLPYWHRMIPLPRAQRQPPHPCSSIR